MINNNTLNNL